VVVRQKFKNTPPGPWANHIPFIGSLPLLTSKNPEKLFAKLAEKYGKIYSLQMGSIFTVVLSDVALIREAFRRDEFSGRAPLRVTHGIFYGHGEATENRINPSVNFKLHKQGLICTEGALWKDQRGLTVKWLRDMGMIKYGPKRDSMQQRIMEGINQCMAEIGKLSSKEINPMHTLANTVGNIVNDFVFGITFDANDETWQHLQYLQEVGTKLVGVGASANFLPILRYALENSIVSTATCLEQCTLCFSPDFSPSTDKT
jgi:ecdysteroid 25-hydroxylase